MAFWSKTKSPPTYNEITMPIEYGFSVNGTDYWRFSEAFNIPPVRGLKAVTFFEEARMRCDEDYLKKHTEATDKLLTAPVIDIFKIKTLNDQLRDRVSWKMPTLEMMYKVASVTFFDKSEHPANYDFAYNQKKIEFWKKHGAKGIDFFLQLPLLTLMPFLGEQPENLRSYSAMVEELNEIHLESLSSILETALKPNNLSK